MPFGDNSNRELETLILSSVKACILINKLRTLIRPKLAKKVMASQIKVEVASYRGSIQRGTTWQLVINSFVKRERLKIQI